MEDGAAHVLERRLVRAHLAVEGAEARAALLDGGLEARAALLVELLEARAALLLELGQRQPELLGLGLGRRLLPLGALAQALLERRVLAPLEDAQLGVGLGVGLGIGLGFEPCTDLDRVRVRVRVRDRVRASHRPAWCRVWSGSPACLGRRPRRRPC